MPTAVFPHALDTDRLRLRKWRREDAPRLLPVLEANVEYVGGWIPSHVASPVPLPELERRLSGFAEDFAAGRCWRWALFTRGSDAPLGEVSLFPRSATERVPFAAADRLEIGYWLDREATGKGYATEAARALFDLARRVPGIVQVEIHCDPRNLPSAAVPRRLGFRLVDDGSAAEPGAAGMIWASAG
ncbi:MAG TPA: GNAT family N-acetyltransferase [Woeseiaceae bacterium]